MTTPDQQPNPQQQPQQAIAADDLLAQRPAAIAEPVRAATPPTGRPSVTAILAAVVVAAVMFAGGLLVGHATSASAAAQGTAGGLAGNGRGFGGGGAGRTGGTAGQGGLTAGKITSIDGSTLTITTSDGKTVKVTTTSTTTVSKTTQSDVASLATGETVTVIGPAAADGSVAAQRISEGTAGFGGQGGGARLGATPAPTR